MSPETQAPAHTVFGECVSLWVPHGSTDCVRVTTCASPGQVSGTRDPPPSVGLPYSAFCGSRPYHLAVCPLASSLCLPTWLAPSSGNKGGVQFWAVPGSGCPTPSAFPFQEPWPSQSWSWADPLVLRGPFPQSQGEERLSSWLAPPFLTPWPPFLSPARPLKPHLSRLEAAPLPIVWPGFGSSGFHSNPWAFN